MRSAKQYQFRYGVLSRPDDRVLSVVTAQVSRCGEIDPESEKAFFQPELQNAPTKNPPYQEGRRFPLCCSLGATSAFAIHLAREGQVGLGVDPNLDAARIMCLAQARLQQAGCTQARCKRVLKADDPSIWLRGSKGLGHEKALSTVARAAPLTHATRGGG